MNRERLNQMWRAGYCKDTIAFAAQTNADTRQGRDMRRTFLKNHIRHEECQTCLYANTLKGAEQRLAHTMGSHATEAFSRGEDITRLPGYQQYQRDLLPCIVDAAQEQGVSLVKLTHWITKTAEREDYGWEKEAKKETGEDNNGPTEPGA